MVYNANMHRSIASFGIQNWDDVRFFLAVARTGSFLRAAALLNTNQSTVSRRIHDLELQLGARLFDRCNRGARLTPTGRIIQQTADAMEGAILDIERGVAGVDTEMRGTVTITTTEGVGSYWLGPRMLDFQRQNPGLTICIDTSSAVRDLATRQADIAIRFGRPDIPSYRVRQVARLQMMPFASRHYLREFGKPATLRDLKDHFFVEYDPPFEGPKWAKWYDLVADCKGVVFRSNSSHAVGLAVNAGYGVGLLPIYAPHIHANLEELPFDIGPKLELWIATHEETGRSRRVRATVEHIYKLFQVDRYRYFSD